MVSRTRWLLGGCIAIGIVAYLAMTVFLTAITLHSLKTGQLEQAQSQARQAQFLVRPLGWITLKMSNSIQAWQAGLKIAAEAPNLFSTVTDYSSQILSLDNLDNNAGEFWEQYSTFVRDFHTLTEHLEHSFLGKMTPTQLHQLKSIDQILVTTQPALLTLMHGNKRIVLLLQNTQELRATGGFTGSFILLELQDGSLKNWQLHDIYEPDGQFSGFVAAPPGVQEYLSEGKGWRLPNANWSADFPSAAQTTQEFLELGGFGKSDYIVSINLEVLEHILTITGPISLPDQNLDITAQNSSQLLRSQRGEFFAGSQAKKVLLQNLFTQLVLRLQITSPAEYIQISQALQNDLAAKSIQLYAQDPATQRILSDFQLTGAAVSSEEKGLLNDTPTTTLYIFPIESNVGINKANATVQRSSRLEQLSPFQWRVSTLFSNTAADAKLGYINYYRFWLSPAAKILTISQDGEPLSGWDEAIITTSNGSKLKEIGFLSLVPATTQAQVAVTFEVPFAAQKLILKHQSGVSEYAWSVRTPLLDWSQTLYRDMTLQLQPTTTVQ